MTDLLVDFCSYEAAKYAVMHWHYSKAMPVGKLVKVGAWENGQYIGAVLFGRGAIPNIGSPYKLAQTEICELVRVALDLHQTMVSKIISYSFRLLRIFNSGLRLIVSYADPQQGHNGSIYQAGNWVYVGDSQSDYEVFAGGKWMHRRSAVSRFGTSAGWNRKPYPGRHKYLYPLDRAMRRQIAPLAQPYPKRVRSIDGDTPGCQPEEGGSTPTRTLEA